MSQHWEDRDGKARAEFVRLLTPEPDRQDWENRLAAARAIEQAQFSRVFDRIEHAAKNLATSRRKSAIAFAASLAFNLLQLWMLWSVWHG